MKIVIFAHCNFFQVSEISTSLFVERFWNFMKFQSEVSFHKKYSRTTLRAVLSDVYSSIGGGQKCRLFS